MKEESDNNATVEAYLNKWRLMGEDETFRCYYDLRDPGKLIGNYYTKYIVRRTLYVVHCTWYILRRTLYFVHCTWFLYLLCEKVWYCWWVGGRGIIEACDWAVWSDILMFSVCGWAWLLLRRALSSGWTLLTMRVQYLHRGYFLVISR